jgi:hypothetical protein
MQERDRRNHKSYLKNMPPILSFIIKALIYHIHNLQEVLAAWDTMKERKEGKDMGG